jgi:hypothetical protein
MTDKLTPKQIEHASKLAMKNLILPSGARIQAIRNLSNTFTPNKRREYG